MARAGIISSSATGIASVTASPDATSITFVSPGPVSTVYNASSFIETINDPNLSPPSSVLTFNYNGPRDTGLFTGLDRLVLELVNSTGRPLVSIDFRLSAPAGIDGGLTFGGSYSSATFTYDGTDYGPDHSNGGGIADGFLAAFNPLVDSGNNYALYIPINLPTDNSSGSFTLSETISVAPLPNPAWVTALGMVFVVITSRWASRRKLVVCLSEALR